MYMDEYKKYSSIEAFQIAEMAREKGLILLEGDYNTYSCMINTSRYEFAADRKGYVVAKLVMYHYLTLDEDGTVFQDYNTENKIHFEAVWFRLTLEQAKERIINFDGTIKNPPNFYAYVRVYLGEPNYYSYLQQFFLDEFARKHGIVYKEKFVCFGGKKDIWIFPDDDDEIDDIVDCCKESFSDMTENDFLVVTDSSRLNYNPGAWRSICNVISVACQDMGYTTYVYQGKPQQEYGEEMEDAEDIQTSQESGNLIIEQDELPDFAELEYEQMSREHSAMMMEQDEPFIELEDEQHE